MHNKPQYLLKHCMCTGQVDFIARICMPHTTLFCAPRICCNISFLMKMNTKVHRIGKTLVLYLPYFLYTNGACICCKQENIPLMHYIYYHYLIVILTNRKAFIFYQKSHSFTKRDLDTSN